MHIQFVEPANPDRIRRMYRAANWKARRRMRWMVLPWVIVGGALGFLLSDSTGHLDLLIFAAAGCALCTYVIAGGQSPLKRRVREEIHPVTTVITDLELESISPVMRAALPWTAVARVEDRDHFWIVRNEYDRAMFFVPQECMAPEQVAELRMFLVNRSLTPQTYRI